MTQRDDEKEGTTSAEDAELVRACRGWLSPHWDGALPPEAQQDFRRAAARIEALSRKPQVQVSANEVLAAVARGWCYPANQHKEVDATLAASIVREVCELLRVAKELEGRK